MARSDIADEVENALDVLVRAEVALMPQAVVEYKTRSGHTRVSWPEPANDIGDLYRTPVATLAEYRRWVQESAYSAMLFDGSLLQLTYDVGRAGKIVGHRLVYFPCPFDAEPELWREWALLDVIDCHTHQDDLKLRGPLRFDYDPDNQKDGHPASHLTILHSECRWATAAPLSVGTFLRFIFSHFYRDLWTKHESLRTMPMRRIGARSLATAEEAMLHINWFEAAIE